MFESGASDSIEFESGQTRSSLPRLDSNSKFSRDDHHGDGVFGLWVAAAPGVQEELVGQEPERFYRPPYVGHRGWVGVRLDIDVDWGEIGRILEDAYRQVAPKTLVKLLDADT